MSATLDLDRALSCFESWRDHSAGRIDYYIVEQAAGRREWEQRDVSDKGRLFGMESREILGPVPAFAIGVQKALEDGAEIIACLHDDLLIEEDGWDETVIRLFKACPRAGLCGFGGGKGLGSDDIYQTPYNPMQLARQRFISNMRDAESHGERVEVAQPVACLDGFSQIGTRAFWSGVPYNLEQGDHPSMIHQFSNLFSLLQEWGVVHHFYDGMLGCFAKRLRYQTWFLPVKCHHFGGRTAVGDARYTEWANRTHRASFIPIPAGVYTPGATFQLDKASAQIIEGDALFWQQAHEIGYNEFKDVLPIRT